MSCWLVLGRLLSHEYPTGARSGLRRPPAPREADCRQHSPATWQRVPARQRPRCRGHTRHSGRHIVDVVIGCRHRRLPGHRARLHHDPHGQRPSSMRQSHHSELASTDHVHLAASRASEQHLGDMAEPDPVTVTVAPPTISPAFGDTAFTTGEWLGRLELDLARNTGQIPSPGPRTSGLPVRGCQARPSGSGRAQPGAVEGEGPPGAGCG
jgi:hypothetical protein